MKVWINYLKGRGIVNKVLKSDHVRSAFPKNPVFGLTASRLGTYLWMWPAVLGLLLTLEIGCVAQPRQLAKQPNFGHYRPQPQEFDEPSSGMIKPAIPSQGPQGQRPQASSPVAPRPPAGFDRPAASAGQGRKWEDQKVREAALEIAKSVSTVKKIKVCYETAKDEWWVTLYDESGGFIDLKQFVWERKNEQLEPFLVLNRIPRSKMEEHIRQKEPGRACEAFDPPARPM